MSEAKNQSINFLKGISCIIVILLHCPFPGVVGDLIIYAFRFSVPIFFMISGYFSIKKPDHWILKKIKTTITMIVLFELLQGVLQLIINVFYYRKNAFDFLLSLDSFQHPVRTFFFGSFFNGPLWYLYAMFWTWLILYFIRRRGLVKYSFYAIPVLLALHIFGRYYIQNRWDIRQYVHLFRSGILFGLPFVLLGLWMATYREKILAHLSIFRCLALIFSGHVLIIIEYILSKQYMDLHVSTVVIAVGLFLLAIYRPSLPFTKPLAYLGEVYSMWIYYLHSSCIVLIRLLWDAAGWNQYPSLLWLQPLAVGGLALMFASIIRLFQKKQV